LLETPGVQFESKEERWMYSGAAVYKVNIWKYVKQLVKDQDEDEVEY
jgi:hypothetical protein